MSTITRGYEEGCFKCLDNHKIRMCVHHFRTIVIEYDNNEKFNLKIESAPIIYLNKCSIENEKFKE